MFNLNLEFFTKKEKLLFAPKKVPENSTLPEPSKSRSLKTASTVYLA